MNCPGCGTPTTAQTYEAHLGRSVEIDTCFDCQFLWFDQGESLQLSPAATLRLFRAIGEHGMHRPAGVPSQMACPRCAKALALAHDRQRNTPFQYWRCPAGHGRLTSFFDFLREKDFIRPLSREQVEELRRSVDTVNCSNCGAAVDVVQGAACAHCRSPLSMLDMKQAERLVAQLRGADRSSKPVDPALPLELARARRDVEQAFAAFEKQPEWTMDVSSAGLVGAGIMALARWLGKSAR